jgi:hypothetical protein
MLSEVVLCPFFVGWSPPVVSGTPMITVRSSTTMNLASLTTSPGWNLSSAPARLHLLAIGSLSGECGTKYLTFTPLAEALESDSTIMETIADSSGVGGVAVTVARTYLSAA